MKKIMTPLYFFAVLLLIQNSPALAQTPDNSAQIKETVLNYLEGMESNNQ
ncbi:hypothetical protein [Robiginitalea sp. IMCC43444]